MIKQRGRFLEGVLGALFSINVPDFDIETYLFQTLFDAKSGECRLKPEGKARGEG